MQEVYMENTGNFNDNTYRDTQLNYNKTGEKIQFPIMDKVYNLIKQTINSSKQNFLQYTKVQDMSYDNYCISELTHPGDCLPLESKYLRRGIILLSTVRAGVNSKNHERQNKDFALCFRILFIVLLIPCSVKSSDDSSLTKKRKITLH